VNASRFNPGRSEEIREFIRRGIVTDTADRDRPATERGDIHGRVRRTARCEGPAFDLDDRHRRFRRNSADPAPDEFVEHQVADDEYRLAG
jgi:hypothetical protein